MLLVAAARAAGGAARRRAARSGMAPAAIRNVVVAHQWTLVSSHGGLNFYIGNSARRDRASTGPCRAIAPGDRRTGDRHAPRRGAGARASGHRRRGVELFLRSRARTWIRGAPRRRRRAVRRRSSPSRSTRRTSRCLTAIRFSPTTTHRHPAVLFVGPWLIVAARAGWGLVCCVTGSRVLRVRRAFRIRGSSGCRSSRPTRRRSRCSLSRNAIACRCWCRSASAPARRSISRSARSQTRRAGVALAAPATGVAALLAARQLAAARSTTGDGSRGCGRRSSW